MKFSQQAEQTVQQYHMLPPGSVVIAGLSGGADSVSLLHWLCSVQKPYGLRLYAAHVNHGLRGADSNADEQFCRALCEDLHVPLQVKQIDAKALAKAQGIGIEEAGRRARYEFYAECVAEMPKAGAPPQVAEMPQAGVPTQVALAHTLSDRAETFLMNFTRGTALRGLCSIPPVRQLSTPHAPFSIPIVRPLIECSRAQVEAYCEEHGLAYRQDSSNEDTKYRRNFIRHEVMPLLQPRDEALRHLFRCLAQDEAFLAAAAQDYTGDVLAAPEALKGRLLRDTLTQRGQEPSAARMRELEKQLASGMLARTPAETPAFQGKRLQFTLLSENFTKNLIKNSKEVLANCLDYDTIDGNLMEGRRAPGDSMRAVNGAGTKSFKQLCQERGIAPHARGTLALARDAQGVAWMEGVGCAHRCRITEQTTRAIMIEILNS